MYVTKYILLLVLYEFVDVYCTVGNLRIAGKVTWNDWSTIRKQTFATSRTWIDMGTVQRIYHTS